MGAGNRRGRTEESGSYDTRTGPAGRTRLAGRTRPAGHTGLAGKRRGAGRAVRRLILLAAIAGFAGPAAAQADKAAQPAAVECACSLSFSYSEPLRYRYWRRERVHADLLLRLSAADGDGDYRAAPESETALCRDVREERKGEPFRSVDMCIETGQWLARIREEARCSFATASDGKDMAECRLPDPDPKAGSFLTARQAGSSPAAAMCNAYAHMVELRLAADIAAFEADNLHGLPDLAHAHLCLPR